MVDLEAELEDKVLHQEGAAEAPRHPHEAEAAPPLPAAPPRQVADFLLGELVLPLVGIVAEAEEALVVAPLEALRQSSRQANPSIQMHV